MPRHKSPIVVTGAEVFHIYPIEDVSIDGVQAVEKDVTEDEWLRLNEFQPSAFVNDPLVRGEAQQPQEGTE